MTLDPSKNKFHRGNKRTGKHYWLTPSKLLARLQSEFAFDFDACPHPLPRDFDGLTCDWGKSTFANIPFGSIVHQGKIKGPTAWVRKAIVEASKGKRVVMLIPLPKWFFMLLKANAEIRNLGDVKWIATEDGSEGVGNGKYTAAFILGKRPS